MDQCGRPIDDPLPEEGFPRKETNSAPHYRDSPGDLTAQAQHLNHGIFSCFGDQSLSPCPVRNPISKKDKATLDGRTSIDPRYW